MQLCHYLTPQAILIPVKGKSKPDLLRQLVSALTELHHLKQPKRILHAIVEREKVGSTFLSIGVAMPHARLNGIDEIKMVMGVVPEGIEEVIGDRPYRITIIFLFISPLTEKEFGRHLKLLAQIAALFREEHLVHAITKCTTPKAVFDLLQRTERANAEAHEERTTESDDSSSAL